MREKCKHNFGWCAVKDVHLFVNSNNEVSIGFGRGGQKKGYGIEFRCNYPECNARRNIYITGKIVSWGKIKT